MFTVGKLSLCAPFGFLALLFESLHFFLAFLVRSGHQASFQIYAGLVRQKAIAFLTGGNDAAPLRLASLKHKPQKFLPLRTGRIDRLFVKPFYGSLDEGPDA